MRASKLCFCLAIALTTTLLGGCAYSLHPLYNTSDNVREPGLAGIWTDKDNKITIQENSDGSYELSGTDANSHFEARYDVHLVRLGGNLFADAIFDAQSQNGKDIDLPGGVVPLHVIYKVSLSGDTLQTAGLNHDWLLAQFKTQKISIAHEMMGDKPDGDIVFTAPPDELRKFIAQIADTPDAFAEPDTLHRQKQVGAGAK
ncbi:MAG: hypothetical protein WBE20_16415 [Candidatus Acidiferrales bacterium]